MPFAFARSVLGYGASVSGGGVANWSATPTESKIYASNAGAGDFFGQSVSINSDGTYAIIGANREDSGAFDAGSAYIFTRSGSTWTEQQQITASDAESTDLFGDAVAISGDGSYVIVGAPFEDTVGSAAGSAYIFTRSGSTWTQQQKIQSSDIQADDRFGDSVSISSDGSYAIIGARQENSKRGAAYIFTRSGSTWTQQAKLTASDAQANDEFSWSVSMSSDGSYAIVGALREDTGGTDAGAAYIFTRSGSTWTQQQKILSSDIETGDRFGISVSINSDGTYAIVGAYFEATGGSNTGSAYIFTRSGSTWTQQQKIQASDAAAGDRFGQTVSINGDATYLIASAQYEVSEGTDTGAAYIFSRSGSTWTQERKIRASDATANVRFSSDVSMSADGNYAIVGAIFEDTQATNAGAAYIYEAG